MRDIKKLVSLQNHKGTALLIRSFNQDIANFFQQRSSVHAISILSPLPPRKKQASAPPKKIFFKEVVHSKIDLVRQKM
ncbi:TPA: hypothetical protein DCW54_00435 [Candidatus Dependentiae bacterium]|nr:hypothetical protein [Candidatus Dependentiae bacterium]